MAKRGLFYDLKVRQKGMELSEIIYTISKAFPKEEVYGLTSQIRRCAVSIPSNIAEGNERTSNKEFRHFLEIAKGSAAELQTQIILAKNIGYMKNDEQFKNIINITSEIRKMISGLIKSLSIT